MILLIDRYCLLSSGRKIILFCLLTILMFFMRSIENLGFSEANFKIVNPQLLYPHSHGVLGSLRNLVNSSYKYVWRSHETLEKMKKSKRVRNKREKGSKCDYMKAYTIRNKPYRERGNEGTRERGNEGTRERGNEGTRERGNEGTRERGNEGTRERGNEGTRERGSKGKREQGSKGARE